MRRLLAAALLVAAVAVSIGVVSRDDGTARQRDVVAVDPHGAEIEQARTLVVSSVQPPASRPGVLLYGRLVEGAMPTDATEGTVLTDEDCAADFRGISNCLNRIRLEDGLEIAVRHPHDMREVPCFAPGEPVRIVPT